MNSILHGENGRTATCNRWIHPTDIILGQRNKAKIILAIDGSIQRQFRELTGLHKCVSWLLFNSKILKECEQIIIKVKISNSFAGSHEERGFCEAEDGLFQFETGSHYIAPAGFELTEICPPPPPEHWHYRCEPPYLALFYTLIKTLGWKLWVGFLQDDLELFMVCFVQLPAYVRVSNNKNRRVAHSPSPYLV